MRCRDVIVVEDDPDVQKALSQILEFEGFKVYVANNGKEALTVAQNDTCPCLILLDLMMPVMSGWEFRQEQLRDPELAGIPVVVVTAFEESIDGTELLRKPFLVEDVLDAVQRLAA